MAVIFTTDDPKALLAKFEAAILQVRQIGKIKTWAINPDNKSQYTHQAQQWARKAYIEPVLSENKLTFYIKHPPSAKVALDVYAFYQGHLIETFINHFDGDFKLASASPKPASLDQLG